ncbi:uncharacterized protein NEPG_01026 [Nematocida parisii ERTm1]|nr:uncharacterized protein NEPG_01026 [Nematocida parisii ERTm1]EIJ94358.1 hypothetical protein NEPG_01026 [Nematocida parisii ERTm1]|eukprot:XP_013058854.1 hypothetical protein NEPG_01026 [Nematocida parisii ERTm1]
MQLFCIKNCKALKIVYKLFYMKTVELCAGYFNLLKTIMGAGIISYPMFFCTYGSITATVFSCIAAILTFFSLMMLCECADYANTRDKTFSAVLSKIWPGISGMFNVIVFVKCFGVSISYLVLLQPMLIYLLKMTGIVYLQNITKVQITLLYVLIMFPICTMKDLKSLRYSSMIGIFGVYICIAGSIYNYMLIRDNTPELMPNPPFFNYPSYKWIGSVGQFIFSFTCHQNIFSIRSSLTNPSSKNMKYITGLGIGTALILYVVFGFIIYMAYGDKTQDNIFVLFADGKIKNAVYIFYTLFISCSLPLQIYPARDCLVEWVSTRSNKNTFSIRVWCTGLLITAAALISLPKISLTTIQTVVGGTASTIMCNFIPAVCIMKIPRKKSYIEKNHSISASNLRYTCS